MRSDDELEGLRRAWDEVEPPPPIGDSAQADAAERAALAWLRAAWEQVGPPAPPRWAAPVARPQRRSAWIAAAAAAGLAGLWLSTASLREDPRREAGREPGIALLEPEVDFSVPEEHPDAPREVEVASVTSDRMELRSGPVRLILLTPSAGPAAARSEDD